MILAIAYVFIKRMVNNEKEQTEQNKNKKKNKRKRKEINNGNTKRAKKSEIEKEETKNVYHSRLESYYIISRVLYRTNAEHKIKKKKAKETIPNNFS